MSAASIAGPGLLGITPAVRRRLLRRNTWTIGIYALMLILLAVEKLIHQNFSNFDFVNLASTAMPLAFAAMSQACIVLIGGIDLSIGQTMALVNVVAITGMGTQGMGHAVLVSILVIIGTAIVYGLVGFIITISHVPDIIVTLATSFIWYGIALRVMETPGGQTPIEFYNLANGNGPLEIPEALIVLVVALLLLWLPFYHSRLGLRIYALGRHRPAAFLSGVSVAKTRIMAYAFGGVFAALAGLALSAYTSSGDPNSAQNFTLNSIAAVVLGGVSLAGGRGGLAGPAAAAIVLSQVLIILNFLNVNPNYTQVIQGAVVVVVVLFAGLLALRGERR
jgi:ribose transport system permease protein